MTHRAKAKQCTAGHFLSQCGESLYNTLSSLTTIGNKNDFLKQEVLQVSFDFNSIKL